MSSSYRKTAAEIGLYPIYFNAFKKCTKCECEKTLNEFGKHKNSKDGLNWWCKSCKKEVGINHYKNNKNKFRIKSKIYRDNNKHKIKARIDAYRYNNREEILVKKKKHYKDNREEIAIKRKKWRKNNAKKLSISKKKYNDNNKTKRNAISLKRYHSDEQYRLSCVLRNRIYVAVKGNFKSGSAVSDLGCSIQEFKEYLESKFTEGMTWDNWGYGKGKWNIDHIVPLSSFRLTDREQFLKACNFSNQQPLWQKDNLSKGSKVAA